MAGGRTGCARAWLIAPLLALLVVTGCSDPTPTPDETGSSTSASPSPSAETDPRPISEAKEPDSQYSLVASDDASELAVAASRAYIGSAQVAILAPADDRGSMLRAASIGAAVGAPVLLTGGQAGVLDTELVRLGVVGVVTVGAVDLSQIDTEALAIAPAPEDAADLGDLLGTRLSEVDLPAGGEDADDLGALLALEDGQVFAQGDPAAADDGGGQSGSTEPDSTETGTGTTDQGSSPAPDPTAVGELPAVAAATQIEGSVVVADGSAAQVAAVATGRAAGADVLRVHGDIRGDGDAISSLSDLAPTTVVGLGTSLGTAKQFTWRTATAETGAQLPGGGQLVFNGTRYVALYGSPATASLGILGEQGVDETVKLAGTVAGRYDDLTSDTVVPALEIIVTVASGSAGEDGNYSNEWSPDTFVPLIEAAAEAGQYVVLDFQPGRSTFLEQVKEYTELLEYPNVGIALDPEWRLGPDEMPLQQIGSVGIDEVNSVVGWLADFVQERHLPQKLLVLHQFQLRMITDRQDLDTSRTEVALLIHADGQGTQGAKQATWRTLHEGAPDGVHWGWKNFIDEDSPMLSPKQTYSDVDPVPDFVSYQ